MRRLGVKLRELVDAMTTSREDPSRYWLDVQTGAIVAVLAEGDDDEDDVDLSDHIEIPRNDARTEHDVMASFAETVTDEEYSRLLYLALRGRGAFARFRDVVQADDDLLRAWRAFKERSDRERALSWLHDQDIVATDLSPAPPPPAAAPGTAAKAPRVALVDLLLLGAERPEVVDGRVHRRVRLGSADEARGAFRDLARELCALTGLPWRKSLVAGKSEVDIDRFHLRLVDDDAALELGVDVPPATRGRFVP